jgi:Zn-dependent protease
MFFPGVPLFGWAKPVPIDPTRFRRGISMPTGMLLSALAGPISNFVLAILSTVGLALIARFIPALVQGDSAVVALLLMMMRLNVSLAIFNLIPIPPLDGSRIVEWLLPYRLRAGWDAFCRMSPFLLLLLFYAAPYVMPGPMRLANELLDGLFFAIQPATSQVGMQ